MNINNDKALSVERVNNYIKAILENDFSLQDIWIEGELSNVKFYAKGNQLYFNLTDGKSSINCVIYSQFLRLLTFKPKDGLAVFARGKIKVFQNKGSYIFQVAFLSLDGIGKKNLAFEELKNKLANEGLFNAEAKKLLPQYPKSIGIITSPDSAAMWDFVNSTREHFGYFSLNIIPAIMQGQQAALSIVDALNFSENHRFDIIVIIRGGGSKEDFSCFNDELLLRRVFHHKTPIIVGIGHDVDTCLLDYVADKSCATPTAVAQEITAPFTQIKQQILHLLDQLNRAIAHQLEDNKAAISDHINHIDDSNKRLISQLQSRFEQISKQLTYSNPLHQLERGYSICTHLDTGKTVKSIQEVNPNDTLQVRLFDGILTTLVSTKDSNDK